MVADLIDRDALLNKQHTQYDWNDVVYVEDIQNAPTIDAVPIVHGHWVNRQLTDPENKRVELDSNGLVCSSAYCSVCGEWLVASDEYAPFGLYCPHCGAKMDERKDNEC